MSSCDFQIVRDHFARLVRGRRCILAVGPVAASTRWVELLRELGSAPLLVLGEGKGTGEHPSEDDAHSIDIIGDREVVDLMSGVRLFETLLRYPPDDVQKVIDDYDPDASALYISAHTTDVFSLGGRPRYGPRQPDWAALEDKVVVGRLWERAGIEQSPSLVVAAELDAMRSAAARVDAGHGTAWAGDAREGFNGGAEYVRRVRSDDDACEAAAFFAGHCDRVRVMPWLEGIPCSIHGIVFADGVAALRPVEMITLRRPGQTKLQYAGAATYWDPPAPDREAMRDVALRVGGALDAGVGYRGGFTVDGVLTAEGFRPTELNARAGAGLNIMARGLDALPLLLLAVTHGEPLALDPARVESAILEVADAERAGGAWALLFEPPADPGEHPIVWTPAGRYRRAARKDEQDASVFIGPATTGGLLRYQPDQARTPVGPSLAPCAVQAFALADRELGTKLGPLEAARPA